MFRQLLTIVTLLFIGGSGAMSKDYTVCSPNGKNKVTVSNGINLSITHNDKPVVKVKAGLSSLSDVQFSSAKTTTVTKTISAPFYRQSSLVAVCRQVDLKIGGGFGLQVRAYDEGVAYRWYTTRKKETVIEDEVADFIFPHDGKAWLAYSTDDKKPFAMAFQNVYDETLLSEAKNQYAFLPATVESGDALSAAFARYPKKMAYYPWRGMSYVDETESFIAKSTGARTYPWRVMAITEDDREMPVNNLVYALATPNQIGDISWIKSGKVAWDWWNDWNLKGVDFKAGINTRTYKYYIDFAARNKIPYVVLDEGWYDSAKGDIMNPIADIDLQGLIDYGKAKSVSIVLWTVFNVLDEHLTEACEKYSRMGIKGWKADFLDRNDQTAVEMAERIAKTCARYRLFVDYHGYFAPTGMNRTYPNILNYEGVFGMEEARWAKKDTDMPQYDVTFPYIRMMAGNVDFTPGAMRNGTKKNWVECYENPVSMGTRCHQLACYVVHDSPFTMLCDAPTNYEQEPEYVNIITSIPDTWEETRILQGKMGSYIVTARRRGNDWYVAGQTNWDEREIMLPLDFLPASTAYRATIVTDGINANHNAEDYQVETTSLVSGGQIRLQLASGGGFLLKLIKQ